MSLDLNEKSAWKMLGKQAQFLLRLIKVAVSD